MTPLLNLKDIAKLTGRSYPYICRMQKYWMQQGLQPLKTGKGGSPLFEQDNVIETFKRIAQGKTGGMA